MNKFLTCDLLNSFSEIIQGFSTRLFDTRIEAKGVCSVKQVHGTNVFDIKEFSQLKSAPQVMADILISRLSQVALTIRTADCVPILFFDPVKKAIGAAHAGWRGSAQFVSQKAVQALRRGYGCDPKNIRVALGPAIGGCCYEVDEKVYDAIKEKGCFEKVEEKEGRWMLSLQKLNRNQLRNIGILDQHIWISDECTACQGDRFFSYRREGKAAGRQWSFILLKGAL